MSRKKKYQDNVGIEGKGTTVRGVLTFSMAVKCALAKKPRDVKYIKRYIGERFDILKNTSSCKSILSKLIENGEVKPIFDPGHPDVDLYALDPSSRHYKATIERFDKEPKWEGDSSGYTSSSSASARGSPIGRSKAPAHTATGNKKRKRIAQTPHNVPSFTQKTKKAKVAPSSSSTQTDSETERALLDGTVGAGAVTCAEKPAVEVIVAARAAEEVGTEKEQSAPRASGAVDGSVA